jgi:IS5 family transposase
MLLLKHVRNWSFDTVEREVPANLLYRDFTRVGGGKVPDAKTLGRQARALGPEVVKQIHVRMVELAVENKVVQGRKIARGYDCGGDQYPLPHGQHASG